MSSREFATRLHEKIDQAIGLDAALAGTQVNDNILDEHADLLAKRDDLLALTGEAE